MNVGWRGRSRSDSTRAAEKDRVNKLYYSIAGFASLAAFFTLGFGFFTAPFLADASPGETIVLGLAFYAFFYAWLFLLAKIVYPRAAFIFALGVSVIYFVLDVLFPPYFVSTSGQILLSGAPGSFGASDVLEAETLQLIGIHGELLFLMTYVFVPGLVLFALLPAFWASSRIGKALAGGRSA